MKHKNTNDTAENSRRKFIKAAGKLAIYTPPAMVALMTPSADTFAISGGFVTNARSGGCPPGLAQFGCQPPGLAKKP